MLAVVGGTERSACSSRSATTPSSLPAQASVPRAGRCFPASATDGVEAAIKQARAGAEGHAHARSCDRHCRAGVGAPGMSAQPARRPTIARIWRGRVRRERADEYEVYNYEVGIKPLIEKAFLACRPSARTASTKARS